jgi:hypothetical protein
LSQPLTTTDDCELQVLADDLRPLFDQILLKQLHEQLELQRRPLPVFAAEAIERKLFEAQTRALFDNRADGRNTATVAFDTW